MTQTSEPRVRVILGHLVVPIPADQAAFLRSTTDPTILNHVIDDVQRAVDASHKFHTRPTGPTTKKRTTTGDPTNN